MLKKALLTAALLVGTSGMAQAEFIKGDWSTVGDQLSVVDTETGIEWLSLTQTVGMSIDEVASQLDTTYAGWRLPTSDEVEQIFAWTFNEFSPDTILNDGHTVFQQNSTRWNAASRLIASYMISSFGETYSDTASNATRSFFRGIYINDTTEGNLVQQAQGYNWYYAAMVEEDRNFADDLSVSNEKYGVFLVSDGGATLASLNEPSINNNNPNAPADVPVTFALGGLALLGFGLRRKIK